MLLQGYANSLPGMSVMTRFYCWWCMEVQLYTAPPPPFPSHAHMQLLFHSFSRHYLVSFISSLTPIHTHINSWGRLQWLYMYAITRLTTHLCVASCLIWWFASLEKYGHTWHRMSLLKLGVIKEHNTNPLPIPPFFSSTSTSFLCFSLLLLFPCPFTFLLDLLSPLALFLTHCCLLIEQAGKPDLAQDCQLW